MWKYDLIFFFFNFIIGSFFILEELNKRSYSTKRVTWGQTSFCPYPKVHKQSLYHPCTICTYDLVKYFIFNFGTSFKIGIYFSLNLYSLMHIFVKAGRHLARAHNEFTGQDFLKKNRYLSYENYLWFIYKFTKKCFRFPYL